jgi:hypothetical protein
MVFASVNGDTPRHFNSHLTLYIRYRKVGLAQNIAVIAMLLWYNSIVALLVFGVLLLLWCSNIIATISSAAAVSSCHRPLGLGSKDLVPASVRASLDTTWTL